MFVKQISDLANLYTYPDGTYVFVVDALSIFVFDATSEEADDEETVIRPIMTDLGRWLLEKDLNTIFAPIGD